MLVARNSGKSKFLKGLAGVDAWRSKRPPSFCQRFSNTWKLSGSVFALSDQSSILRREWRMEDEWDFIITLYTFPHRFFVLIYFEMIGSMFHRIYITTLLTNVNGSMFFSPPKKNIMFSVLKICQIPWQRLRPNSLKFTAKKFPSNSMERQKRLDCEGYRARHLHLPESVFGPMFFFKKAPSAMTRKVIRRKVRCF